MPINHRRKNNARRRAAPVTSVPESSKGDITRATVVEALANAHFRVLVDKPRGDAPAEAVEQAVGEEQEPVIAYLAGKMRLHRIRVIVGDTVEVLLDPYGGKPRIVRRL
jgi:translation initiation factor IF-1